MSEDERSLGSAYLSPDLDAQGWLALLRTGSIEILGRMPWSSNATYSFVVLTDGVIEGRGVYKPGRGERPLHDFPARIYRREVASYELAVGLGLGCVPETIERADAPLGEGSIQRFVDADFSEHYFTLLERPEYDEQLRTLAGLDVLLNNADRKGGHVLVDGAGGIWGIDNGLSFHVYPKLRTVMWDYAGDPLPDVVLGACHALASEVPDAVTRLIDPDEIEALRERAEDTLRAGYFPIPDPNRRTHPWPLV